MIIILKIIILKKRYYLQVFLDEYKHVIKEKKNPIKTFITDNRETSSDDFDNKNSDKENSDGEN